MTLKIGVAAWPKVGQEVSGDAFEIIHCGEDTLVALADGLGSGINAAQAAQLAMQTVRANAQASLPDLLRLCHQALLGTRGAVMGLLRVEPTRQRVSYAAIGNIECSTVSAAGFKPLAAYGIVGRRLPHPRPFEGVYTPGDLFALSTDGINRKFSWNGLPSLDKEPQTLAEIIARRFARPDDDVTVLVIR
jgi:serine phosphatase RsbU (regulator of sigma subunit)